MGREVGGGFDAVVHVALWAAANSTYLHGRLRQFGVTPERLARMPAHAAVQWIYPIIVDATSLPMMRDPDDLSGKAMLPMLTVVERWLATQIYPTKDSWGESPRSIEAAAKMEAEMPLDADALAYMEAQRAARQASG